MIYNLHFYFSPSSYDARRGAHMPPKVVWDRSVLGDRAAFLLNGSSPALVVSATRKADEAVYRCRVDFRQHITMHSRVNLTIIGEEYHHHVYTLPSSVGDSEPYHHRWGVIGNLTIIG